MWKITASKGQETQRPQMKNWSHEAMLVQVIDLWTQPWSDKYPESKRKLELMFEILDEKWDFWWEPKPFAARKYVNNVYISHNKDKISNYHWLINSLFWNKTHEEAADINFDNIIWSVYIVQISENNWFSNIDNITRWTEKMQEEYKAFTPYNEKFVFSLEEYNQNLFDWLREKVKAKIINSPEYQKIQEVAKLQEKSEDMPF